MSRRRCRAARAAGTRAERPGDGSLPGYAPRQDQAGIDPLHHAVHRQHHVGQEQVAHAEHHPGLVVEERQGPVGEAEGHQVLVHDAISPKEDHPSIGAHDDAGEEREDDDDRQEPRRPRDIRGR